MNHDQTDTHQEDRATSINEVAGIAAPRRAQILIVTVGLPYSGKTRWARRQGLPIVSPDSIRLALHGQRYLPGPEPFVWAIANIMVRALFSVGHEMVILDATSNTRRRRQEWLSSEWQTFYQVFDASAEVCLERALSSGDANIIPTIGRMASEHEPLALSENSWNGGMELARGQYVSRE